MCGVNVWGDGGEVGVRGGGGDGGEMGVRGDRRTVGVRGELKLRGDGWRDDQLPHSQPDTANGEKYVEVKELVCGSAIELAVLPNTLFVYRKAAIPSPPQLLPRHHNYQSPLPVWVWATGTTAAEVSECW